MVDILVNDVLMKILLHLPVVSVYYFALVNKQFSNIFKRCEKQFTKQRLQNFIEKHRYYKCINEVKFLCNDPQCYLCIIETCDILNFERLGEKYELRTKGYLLHYDVHAYKTTVLVLRQEEIYFESKFHMEYGPSPSDTTTKMHMGSIEEFYETFEHCFINKVENRINNHYRDAFNNLVSILWKHLTLNKKLIKI